MNKNRITGERPETNSTLKIGTHLSVAKGYAALARDAVKIGANTFQLFIRNPRGARANRGVSNDIKKPQFHAFHRPRALYVKSLLRKSAFKRAVCANDGRRFEAHGIHAGESI